MARRRQKPKELAVIFMDEVTGKYRIRTKDLVWVDEFDDEEQATTYALQDGCRVEGC